MRMSTRGSASPGEQRSPRGSDALQQLRRGELTLDDYLDFRADEAVKDLALVLPKHRVDVIRAAMREQLATDPVLLRMVSHLTRLGGLPGAER
jgi:hypothetical protein